MSVFQKILHLGEGKRLKELEALAEAVNALEPSIEPLSDEQLRAKTDEFRSRLADGETVDDIEAEAFAVVREAAKRVLGQRHFDVQVVGAGALHRGMVAEMRTGEGKTLVATMPCYLNGLTGRGVHVVTVNDYLAKRDAEWMGDIHRFLGLEVGLIQAHLEPAERRPAYAADITYGTNNEFGFDYLRDNMAMRPEDMVQRGHAYAIVDEVDSILIDEARTPLIISGRVADTAKWYRDFARIADRLQVELHYEVDEGKKQVITTEEGVSRVEEMLGIENMYDYSNVDLVHHLEAALKAKTLFEKDVDYLVSDGEVKIVDEFTGRVLDGRRYSEGLHQAIEAKEGVAIKDENQTLATITLQNYFRMYDKLAGMTGTAMTEEAEFNQIYGVTLVEIPTNRPIARADQPDLVYMTEKAKYDAVADDIEARHKHGQPVLVGTVSIEKSERLSGVLTKRGIPHEVLNAKQHAREATIVAQAGRIGAVTVATNMAGRGVDIRLGGNPEELAERAMAKTPELEPDTPEYEEIYQRHLEKFTAECAAEHEKVIELGGLYVLATERHESRRIDNQLRGRSGRQGDPGESRFYLSLEDDLMRRFASDRVTAIMARLKMPEDVPIEAKMVSKSIERAQTQVESQNFEIRKNVLKYDEVMNRQREVIYEWRSGILREDKAQELVHEWLDEVMEDVVAGTIDPAEPPARWDWDELLTSLTQLYPHSFTAEDFSAGSGIDMNSVIGRLQEDARSFYAGREEEIGEENLRTLEQRVVLSVIDNKWREHLAEMDYLRAGIGLRAMGQKDPLVEYQREGYDMFSDLVVAVKHDTIRYLSHVQVVQQDQRPQVSPQGRPTTTITNTPGAAKPQADASGKIGRNEPCPCGSGKKYKRCHGAAA
ncbi:MAG: preprotein translocase subunit SecA [Acidimicrobiia bacterium]|nr:preprotein translocase subunit SecA [Acidimicrobiia bacterium]MBT8216392.1 preprotein translocase subunit SecA [Acidimicrobiia bacterium]NNF09503.1 preprotein translocase subunit SecA [Acidimicrobiia bacterium]NNL71033.1 preprotein translocase subunit SecA [Acidimicrobiia bacterium]